MLKKLSGGIGFLLAHDIYKMYLVKNVDSYFTGIPVISLTHKHSGFCVILIGTYLITTDK